MTPGCWAACLPEQVPSNTPQSRHRQRSPADPSAKHIPHMGKQGPMELAHISLQFLGCSFPLWSTLMSAACDEQNEGMQRGMFLAQPCFH